ILEVFVLILRLFLVFFCLLYAQAARAEPQNFEDWLSGLRQEALRDGISEKTVGAALPDTLAPIDKVITLDRKQPETTKTLQKYLHDTLTPRRIEEGRARYRDNKKTLYGIGADYEVDPQYIVALWGIETNFGQNTGGFNLIPALVTLAYDGRRSDYFRTELL